MVFAAKYQANEVLGIASYSTHLPIHKIQRSPYPTYASWPDIVKSHNQFGIGTNVSFRNTRTIGVAVFDEVGPEVGHNSRRC